MKRVPMNKVIYLLTITPTRTNGLPTETVAQKMVWAGLKDVKGYEFYQAKSAKIQVDQTFTVRFQDYDNQNYVLYNNVRYLVIRTFSDDERFMDLTCSKVTI